VFPDAPHPPSEVVFKPALGDEAAAPGVSSQLLAPSMSSRLHAADDDVSAACAWYGWHPNRESCVSFTGVNESLRLIMQARPSRRAAWPHQRVLQCEREQGPFEAVLAFSMGAVFAQIVCAARTCHVHPIVSSPEAPVHALATASSSSPYILPNLKFAVSILSTC
jgi:hypothetical protein